MKTRRLWTTVVGSHLWHMNRPDSDLDEFSAYVVDTRALLEGRVSGGGCHYNHTPSRDEQNHEISRWVEQCLKHNFNYITAVFSPRVSYDPFGLLRTRFRPICARGMATNLWPSLHGMVEGHLRRIDTRVADPAQKAKMLRQVYRSLTFGIAWMQGRGAVYEAAPERVTKDDIGVKIDELNDAMMASSLPDEPPNENEYRAFLFDVRMAELDAPEHEARKVA